MYDPVVKFVVEDIQTAYDDLLPGLPYTEMPVFPIPGMK